MANTPFMNLLLPTVSLTLGPTWASELNTALTAIDGHNHTGVSSGLGQQIPTAGIGINADLSFAGYSPTLMYCAQFTSQGSAISRLGSVNVVGNELYYNDLAGNNVQITSSGNVNAGAGSITGLSGTTAGVAYTSGNTTFTFISATSTPAAINCGPVIIGDEAASVHQITVKSASSLAAAYSLTLPTAVPSAASFVQMSTGGALSATVAVANGITRSNIITMSENSGSASGGSSSTSYVTVASFSVTTNGGAVMLVLQGDTSGSGYLQLFGNGSASTINAILSFYNGTNIVSSSEVVAFVNSTSGSIKFPLGIVALDLSVVGAPGTYTYSVQVKLISGSTDISCNSCTLIAKELL